MKFIPVNNITAVSSSAQDGTYIDDWVLEDQKPKKAWKSTSASGTLTLTCSSGDCIALYAWHAGLKVAKEMAFGRILSGTECVRYGFANYSYPKEKLDEETTKIAKKIATIHPELLSLEKRQMCRAFDIQGFRVSVESGGEFDSLSHKGQSFGYREAVEKYGLAEGLKKLNEPWGGV